MEKHPTPQAQRIGRQLQDRVRQHLVVVGVNNEELDLHHVVVGQGYPAEFADFKAFEPDRHTHAQASRGPERAPEVVVFGEPTLVDAKQYQNGGASQNRQEDEYSNDLMSKPDPKLHALFSLVEPVRQCQVIHSGHDLA